jgi:hypothetical protein
LLKRKCFELILNTTPYFYRHRRWQLLATLICIIYGSVSILNIHPVGDGLWFWYATLLRSGKRLYADMHLPLQPLFVLLSAWTQQLLGNSWLASKVFALAQLIAFTISLLLIGGFALWKDWQKAILIGAAFAMTITPIYIRFDDYHIVGYCCELYTIYLLLLLNKEASLRRVLSTAAVMGILAGLCFSNRLNDGAMLFLASAFALPFFIRRSRILALVILGLVFLLTLISIISLTGDTLHDWTVNSIVRAAAIKGGTGHVLEVPFKFPLTMGSFILHERHFMEILAYEGLIAALFALSPRYIRKSEGQLLTGRIALGIGFLLLTLPLFLWQSFYERPNTAVATFDVIVWYAVSLLVLVRLFRVAFVSAPEGWNPRELVLLIVFLQLVSGAMTSSGQSFQIACYPAGMLLLLVPVASPIRIRKEWQKTVLVTIGGLAIVSALVAKTAHPYHWHHYTDRVPFVQRQWYRHPVYGLMYIERDQLRFMQSICQNISKDNSSNELLSLPYPYPNYFCNEPPWHSYVQTWYDTSSKETIDTLIGELQAAPPQWIIYQRGLDTMELHEYAFTKGSPLPQRALDRLIMNRINQQTWVVVQRENFEGADWILIRTHP